MIHQVVASTPLRLPRPLGNFHSLN
jgi:hypothetical protein